MSRNKENNPLPSSQRASRSSPWPNNHTSHSEEFFTDSVLDVTRIPTPSPKRQTISKPRRAVGNTRVLQFLRDSGNAPHRLSLSDSNAGRGDRQLQPAPILTSKTSPVRNPNDDLTTPPGTSHGFDLTSPKSDLSSPPRGLTDVYQRIADEEDLAATEGELGSDEDYPDAMEEATDAFESQSVQDGHKDGASRWSRKSPETTPVQMPMDADKENNVDDRMETMSEASGLSFMNQLTDQELAQKMTPHLVDRAKDRARIRRAVQNPNPITFNSPARLVNGDREEQTQESNVNGDASGGKIRAFSRSARRALKSPGKAYSDTTADEYAPKRIKAFSKAGRQMPKRVQEENEDDGDSDTPDELRDVEKLVAFSRAKRTLFPKSRQAEPSQSNGVQYSEAKPVAFSKAQKFPFQRPALTEENLDRQHEQENEPMLNGSSTASASTHRADTLQVERQPIIVAGAGRDVLEKWKKGREQRRAQHAQSNPVPDSSQLDWAAAGADVPLPSVEQTSTPQETPPKPATKEVVKEPESTEKLRRWENDFTGMSFQVSESPPVRSRPNAADYVREKEIQNLARQAVTTSRLGEIRKKDSQEQLRRTSRSPSVGKSQAPKVEAPAPVERVEEEPFIEEGEQIPDTPVVVFRSLSNSQQTSDAVNIPDRPAYERQQSHDHLQRLARAMSTTPKTTPPSNGPKLDLEYAKPQQVKKNEDEEKMTYEEPAELPVFKPKVQEKPTVAETPRVTGAWTDTILPETIRTSKQREKGPMYTQTPHVSAGGWIDTPLGPSMRGASSNAPETIEELTEDLAESVQLESPKEELESIVPTQVAMPRSALEGVLSKAKQQRLVSQDITSACTDDTLNLGDATLASLEDLVTLDENDMTTLIRLGAEQEAMSQLGLDLMSDNQPQAEAELLDRLGSKLERLQTNIHAARKGISRIEREVSAPVQTSESMAVASVQSAQSCAVCGTYMITPHNHSIGGLNIPLIYANFTIPIPLLFYPRSKVNDKRLVPQPTPLGYLVLAIWVWYITENTMCELYSHPLHAQRYTWPERPEPVYPYVLPTMLSRWLGLDAFRLGHYVLAPVWTLFVAIARIIGMTLGWTDGFVDGKGAAVMRSATATALKVASSVLPGGGGGYGAGPDLSMMEDEFI